ncbi:MAG: hypothetical protein U9N84_11480 [Actinomycetota bacterium]|nr:hypothetical protein [Actinomycetota bacterium]
MVGDISPILRELVVVEDQLTSLAKEALGEKEALLARQDELRTRAARLADQVDQDCSTQDLLTRLAGLRRQRDAIERQRANVGGQSRPRQYGGFGEASRVSAPGTNHTTAGGLGLSRIDVRIRRVTRILSERGIDLR